MTEKPKKIEKIWVLGGKSVSADKNIPWQENIPNLSNSDRLIMDLNTIPDIAIPQTEIRDYLRYMLMAGKTIYIILKPSNDPVFLWNILPVSPDIIDVKPVQNKSINVLQGNLQEEIVEYSKYVSDCTFFINSLRTDYLWSCLNPQNHPRETYYFTNQAASISEELQFELLNVACQSIGLAAKYFVRGKQDNILAETGQIVFLPPTTKINSEAGVDVLVNSLVGLELKEEEPDWASRIHMPVISDLRSLIAKEIAIVEEATERISNLNMQKNEIEKHKRLLWTFDKPLETAVKDAFALLGFTEVHEGRSKELEDLVIDFKTTNEFIYGVMEVKGHEKRTSMADMNQCDKWVKEYRLSENKKVKGIFVTSQFRRTEDERSPKRVWFEKNEIAFAHDFGICVLPTCELFRAVKHTLEGNKLSRSDIENRILHANPICKLID